jgi:hypothetical protein
VGRLVDWQPELTAVSLRAPLLAAFAARFALALRAPDPQDNLEGW